MSNNDSLVRWFLKKKWVLAIITFDLIVLIAIIILATNNALKTAVVNFNIAPIDATIIINGIKYDNNSGYRLRPGNYEIELSREGLKTKKITIDLADDGVLNVATFLSNGNDFSFYELKGNYDSFYKLAEIASADNNITVDNDDSAEQFIEKYRKEFANYSTVLPINYSEYDEKEDGGRELVKDITIQANSGEECRLTLCLKALMVGTDDKRFVESLLIDKGFNVEDYEIIYKIY